MSKRQFKMAQRVWFAFVEVALSAEFGGAGWATTAQIAAHAGVSKPTVQKYMLNAREREAVSLQVISNRTAVWVWEK